MCSAGAEGISKDLEALEALVVDNRELERLEALVDEFNIFEATGAVRVELSHSDFLAFLLNPTQNHGLGDALVKRPLRKTEAPKWNTIFLHNFLTPKSHQRTTIQELEKEVRQKWDHFLEHGLPAIKKVIKSQERLCQDPVAE